MKYKNNLTLNLHIYGSRVVGPQSTFEVDDENAKDQLFCRLLKENKIVPASKYETSRVEPPEKEDNTEKINLTPIVDTILASVEASVESSIEAVIEADINRALHVDATVTPTSITVNIPVGEAVTPPVAPVKATEDSDKQNNLTETEGDNSETKPKAKTADKPAKTSLMNDLASPRKQK